VTAFKFTVGGALNFFPERKRAGTKGSDGRREPASFGTFPFKPCAAALRLANLKTSKWAPAYGRHLIMERKKTGTGLHPVPKTPS
jgi:hypothetical protein